MYFSKNDDILLYNYSTVFRIKKSILIQNYSLTYRPYSGFASCLNSVLYHKEKPRSWVAYGCQVSLFFNLDSSSAFLCPLWPWHFWRVQASGFVECPSIWECLTHQCVPSTIETSNALSKYLLREETIRWKEKAGFLVSPTPSLFLTEGCYLVAIIVYIGSNPAVFYNAVFSPKERDYLRE